MKKYGGDLTDYGQTSGMFLKNIDALYRAPKKEQDFTSQIENFEDMSLNDLLALVPENWHDNEDNDYWEGQKIAFSGKDGQTNAYVKRGVDDEIEEALPRFQYNQYAWYFATDDNHTRFLSGGKVWAKGREWLIIKVINQDTTATIQNKYYAMDTDPYDERMLQMGVKTLVLV